LLRLAVILATVAVVATHSLLFQQGANGQQELSIQVWLADVKPDTGMVQVCVDIPDTGASKCKKFDGSASKKESLGISSDPTIIDAGIYKLGLERAKENSTLIGCVYVFKDDTGYCTKDKILPINEIHAIMLFTKVKPVFYDKETGRLYRYGQCYFENESTKYCVEDEGIQYPQLKK
jgi:hypothetical protein